MLSFVSSQFLGLFDSSQAYIDLPISDYLPKSESKELIRANVQNGNLHIQHEDLALSGLGLDTVLTRYYNSQAVGGAWKLCNTNTLNFNQDSLPTSITHADGTVIPFHQNENGAYVSYAGNQGKICLTQNTDNAWVSETVSTGERQYFESTGRLIKVENPLSGRIEYHYENERLFSVINASGQIANLVYDGMGRLEQIAVNAQPYIIYKYDQSNRLATAIYKAPDLNSQDYHIQYEYKGTTQYIESVKQDDGNNLSFEYDNNRVVSIREGVKFYNFNYGTDGTDVRFTNGQAWEFKYDATRLRSFTHKKASNSDPIVETYEYENPFNYLSKHTCGDGSEINYDYDEQGWLKEKTDSVESDVERKTTYTRNPQGQVASEITEESKQENKPSIYYFYDPLYPYQPKFKVTNEKRVTEYVYNAIQQLVQERSYYGYFDRPPSDEPPITLDQLIEWSQREEQKYKSSLTEYTYNEYGDLRETKRYSELNLDGSPIAECQLLERQDTDIHGQVITIHNHLDANKNKNFYYDAMGRRIVKTNFFNHATLTQYTPPQDGAPSRATITFSSGLVMDKEFGSAGKVTKETETGSINGQPAALLKTTLYHYTPQNQPYCIEEQDSTTNEKRFQYVQYDAFDRPLIQFDQDGYATEYMRDSQGRIVKTIEYSSQQITKNEEKLTFDELMETKLKEDLINDRINNTAYDHLGRVRYTINARGYITENVYDTSDNIKLTIEYFEEMQGLERNKCYSIKEVHDYIEVKSLEKNTKNRVTCHYYDSDGLEDLQIKPNGGVVAYERDGNGNILKTEQFSNPVDYSIEELGDTTAEEVKEAIIKSPDADIAEYIFHNKRNERTAQIDGENYAREMTRDNHGDAVKETKFYKKATLPNGVPDPRQPWVPEDYGLDRNDPQNEKIDFKYDAEHRELEQANQYSDIQVTEYGYWDEPDAKYTHSIVLYSLNGELVRQSRGFVYTRDARGDVLKSLGSLGLDAHLHGHPDPVGTYATTYHRDGFRRQVKEINNQKHETHFTYTKRGDEKTRVNAENEVTETITNAFHEVKEESIFLDQTNKATTKKSYDTQGNLIQKTDPDGYVFEYGYNAFDEKTEDRVLLNNDRRLVTTTDYNVMGDINTQSQTVYDNSSGNELEHRNQLTRQYDTFSRITEEASAESEKEFTYYDKQSNKIHIRKTQPDIDNATFGEDINYDAFQRETLRHRFYNRHGVRDEQIHTITYSTSEHRKTVISSAHGRESSKTIYQNGFHEVVEENLGNGQLNETRYDANGSVTRQLKNNTECVETHAYDELGLKRHSVKKNGINVTFDYDKAQRQTVEKIFNPFQHSGAAYSYYEVTKKWNPQNLLLEEHTYESKSDTDKTQTQFTKNEYSLRGDKKKTIEDAPSNGIQRTHDYTHDILGNALTDTTSQPGQLPARVVRHDIDNFGRPSETTTDPDNLNIKTSKIYNKDDKLIKEKDGLGRETHYLWEDDYHTKLTIRPSGVVTIDYHNLDSHLIKQIKFAKKLEQPEIDEIIAQNKSVDEVTAMLGDESKDQISLYTYSADEHILHEQQSLAHPINHQLNNAGQEISQQQYQQEIIKIYDKYGHLAYEIDPESYLSRYLYDKSENLLFEMRYTYKVPERKHYTVEELDAVVAQIACDHDRFTYHTYDMMHREQFSLNAEGLLTLNKYDPQGNETYKRTYNARLVQPLDFTKKSYQDLITWSQTEGSALTLAQWVDQNSSPLDHAEEHTLDGLGRTHITKDSLNNQKTLDYDLFDNVTQETNRLGGVTDQRYDKAGRLEETLAPEREITHIHPETGEVIGKELHRPKTTYVHDKADQLKEKTEAKGTTQERTTSYEYDGDGNQTKEILKNVPIYDKANDPSPNTTTHVEIATDLITEDRYDAFNNVISRITADGAESFEIYDKNNRVAYSIDADLYVTKNSYDGYSNKVRVDRFSQPLDETHRQELREGITLEKLESYIKSKEDEKNDRYIIVSFDSLNRQWKLEEPPELYFDSNANDSEEEYFEIGKETIFVYNAHHEVIVKRSLVNPYENRRLDEHVYYNRAGEVISEVNPGRFLITYGNFSFDNQWRNKTEYSNPLLPEQINPDNLTAPTLPIKNLDKDRIHSREINGEGWITKETSHYMPVHEADFEDLYYLDIIFKHVDKTTEHEHDPEGNETCTKISVVNLDKKRSNLTGKIDKKKSLKFDKAAEIRRIVYQFYNRANERVSQLDTPRMVRLTDGSDIEASPLTNFGYDALSREVMAERSDMVVMAQGNSHNERQQHLNLTINQKRATSVWHRDTQVLGKHDEPVLSVQANGLKMYKSYNAVKKVEKEWLNNTYYTLENDNAVLKTEQHTAIYGHDRRGHQTKERKYDRGSITERYGNYNSFGEIGTEGVLYDGDLKEYIVSNSSTNGDQQDFVTTDTQTYYHHNRSGMVVKSNSEDGVWKLFRLNPVAHVTAKYTSQVYNLAQEKFTPKYIINLPKSDFQYTEYRSDELGRTIWTKLPAFSQTQNPLFSTVFVGEPETQDKRNAFGNYAAIWQKPTSFNAKARFKLKLKDSGSENWQELPVIIYGNEMGVTLSHLITDLYDYHIQFYHITDNLEQSEIPYASGKDILAVISENQQGSQHLVCKMVSDTRMKVAGKTIDDTEGEITGLEILHETDPSIHVGVAVGDNGTYEANLGNISSGHYKVRRADITQPVGDPFEPIPATSLTVSNINSNYSAIYTQVETHVNVSVEKNYYIETDEDMRTPDPDTGEPDPTPIENLNHVYVYTMRVQLNVIGSPDQLGNPQSYSIEIHYQSGRKCVYEGRIENGYSELVMQIHEEKIPLEETGQPPHNPAEIDAKVDCPVLVKSVSVDIHANDNTPSLLGNINSLKMFNADPSSSTINIPYKFETNSYRSLHSSERYIHVDASTVKKQKNSNAVALKIGKWTIGAKASEGDYEFFDISTLSPESFVCQYMGPNPLPEKQQKHANEETYVDTRTSETKSEDKNYQLTRNTFLTVAPYVRIMKCTGGGVMPPIPMYENFYVAHKMSTEVYVKGEHLEYYLDYIDGNGMPKTKLVYPVPGAYISTVVTARSDQFNNKVPYEYIKEYFPDDYFEEVPDYMPLFFGQYDPPIMSAVAGLFEFVPYYYQNPYVIKNLKIINRSRNIVIYDNLPFASNEASSHNPMPLLISEKLARQTRYFANEDLTYLFDTNPPLDSNIVSLKVYYEGNYRGMAPIYRPLESGYPYSADLRNLGIQDIKKVSFQFMSPNPMNNYLVENPEFKVQSPVYTRLTISEIPVNAYFLGSQSMYLKKVSEYNYPWPGKTTYKEWDGENKVSTEIYVRSPFLEGEKRVNFKYILASMTGANQTFDSGYYYLPNYQTGYTQTVHSPETSDVNTPAQLLPYPQGVIHYDVDVKINEAWVTLYSGAPNNPRQYVLIKPLPVETNHIEVHFQEQLENNGQHWIFLSESSIKYQTGGIAIVDTTSLPIAHYQYRLRAFRADGSTIDLSAVAPNGVDPQGYAYGKFVITRDPGRIVQVPPPDYDTTEIIEPIIKVTYDFKDNVTSETDAKGNKTEYTYDKNDVKTHTTQPLTRVIKPEPDTKLEKFKDKRLRRADKRRKEEQDRFCLTRIFPSVDIIYQRQNNIPTLTVHLFDLPASLMVIKKGKLECFCDEFSVSVECWSGSDNDKEIITLRQSFSSINLNYHPESKIFYLSYTFDGRQNEDFTRLAAIHHLYVGRVTLTGSHNSLRGSRTHSKFLVFENNELNEAIGIGGGGKVYRYTNINRKGVLLVRPKKNGLKLTQVNFEKGTISVPIIKNVGGIFIGEIPPDFPDFNIDREVEYITQLFRNHYYVDTQIPEELVEDVHPVTFNFPDEFGEIIGDLDANSLLRVYRRDGASIVDTEFYPDQTQQYLSHDIFGYEVFRIDSNTIESKTTNNPHGVPIRVERGRNGNYTADTYELDYHDQIIMHQDADGGRYLSRYNGSNQATHSIDPDKIQVVKLFDINGNPLLESYGDGTNNKYYRDLFSYVVRNKDRGNITFHHQYNFSLLPTETKSESQVNRENAYYDVGQRLPIHHMSHRYYGNNQLYMTYTQPYVEGSTTILQHGIMLYRYDANLMSIGEHFWLDGIAWKDMVVAYNSRNNVFFVADRDYKLEYYEDRVGNIRAVDFEGTDPSNPGEFLDDMVLWYTFSTVNKVQKARHLRHPEGMLYESSTYHSTIANYKNGNMDTQFYYDDDKKAWITDNLVYNDSGYVWLIKHSDNKETTLSHKRKGLLEKKITHNIENVTPVEIESTAFNYSLNGSLQTQHHREDDTNDGNAKPIFDLRQNLPNSRDGAGTLKQSQQEIHPHTNDDGKGVSHMTNDLVHTHTQFNAPTESRVDLTTTFHDHGEVSHNHTQLYQTEYGATRKKTDGNDASRTALYFAMPNKEVVYREEGHVNDPDTAKEVARTSTHQGRIVAQYERKKDENMGRWEVESANQSFADNPFASQPIVVEITKENTTLVDVAKLYCFGHGDAASWLQQHNPQYTIEEKLPIGAKISIPYGQKSQHLTASSSQSHSYAAMIGNTTPSTAPFYVKMPERPKPWQLFIPMAVGTIVTLVVAPYLSKMMGSTLLGTIAAGAAASATGNLSAQATANIVGIADGFDWTQVTTAGVIGAMSAGIGVAGYGAQEGANASKTLGMMHQAAMLNLAEQSYLLATGQQEQFNWQGLVASSVMSVTQAYMPKGLKTDKYFADVAQIMVNQVVNEQVRSMIEGNAFRGSNIFVGAAKQIALYGVAKTTTSAMVRFSTPKQQPKAPTSTTPIKPARRKEEEFEQPTSTEQPARNPSGSKNPTQVEIKNKQVPPIQDKSAKIPVLPHWRETTGKPSLLHGFNSFEDEDRKSQVRLEQAGHSIASYMQNDKNLSTTLKSHGKALSKSLAVTTTLVSFNDRLNNDVYVDSSKKSRGICAAFGAGAESAVWGVYGAGISGLATAAGPTVIGPPAIYAGSVYYIAPIVDNWAIKAGDVAQQYCHDVFKKVENK